MSHTDTELIEFLEKKNKEAAYTGKCVFRISFKGRGWRLYETSGDYDGAKTTVREAIADAINREPLDMGQNIG